MVMWTGEEMCTFTWIRFNCVGVWTN